MEVLQLVRRPFCSYGYDRLLVNKLGDLPEFQGFCEHLEFEADAPVQATTDGGDNTRI